MKVFPSALLVALLQQVLPMPLQRCRAMKVLPFALLVALVEAPMPLCGCWAKKVVPPMVPSALLVALLELVVPMPLCQEEGSPGHFRAICQVTSCCPLVCLLVVRLCQ